MIYHVVYFCSLLLLVAVIIAVATTAVSVAVAVVVVAVAVAVAVANCCCCGYCCMLGFAPLIELYRQTLLVSFAVDNSDLAIANDHLYKTAACL